MSDISTTLESTQQDHAPIRTGENFGRVLRYSLAQIIEFARFSGDANALHQDAHGTRAAPFDAIIASEQQSAAMMMGLVASHFSRSDDGVAREAL